MSNKVFIHTSKITDEKGVCRGAVARISYPDAFSSSRQRKYVQLSGYRNNNALGDPIGFIEYKGRITTSGYVMDLEHFEALARLRAALEGIAPTKRWPTAR